MENKVYFIVDEDDRILSAVFSNRKLAEEWLKDIGASKEDDCYYERYYGAMWIEERPIYDHLVTVEDQEKEDWIKSGGTITDDGRWFDHNGEEWLQ